VLGLKLDEKKMLGILPIYSKQQQIGLESFFHDSLFALKIE